MPGSILLPPSLVSDREQRYGPGGGGGYDPTANFSFNPHALDQQNAIQDLTRQMLRGRVISSLSFIEGKLKDIFSPKLATVAADTQSELQALGVRNEATYQASADTANAKQKVDALIQQKSAQLSAQQSLAIAYSGSDPLTLTAAQRTQIIVKGMAAPLAQYPALARAQQDSYGDSYSAAWKAKILVQSIAILNAQSAALAARLAQAQAAEAEEQARLAAEEVIRAVNTFRVPVAGNKAQLSAVAGSIGLATGSKFTLDGAIQGAIKLMQAAAGVVLDRATGVGIGLLVYSPSLGNSDLYPSTTMTIPASSLTPNLPQNLAAIAAAGGTVDMPYRVVGSRAQYSVVKTGSAGGLSPKVKVRMLTFDPVRNVYTFTSADTPPITLAFPIATPGNSSTGTPAQPMDVQVYTGVTLVPVQIEGVSFPAIDQIDIRDCIYCFPVDSGLPPLYGVFSTPYDGATTTGKFSRRPYNPAKAGGPPQELDWTTAKVTQEGIELVKLHTGRFQPSDANFIMIDRLERILRGEIPITDIDKRFYTHEVRELERYRALGVKDGVEDESVWNDAHTATLEDYRINDLTSPLYTEEAYEAQDRQDKMESKRTFK